MGLAKNQIMEQEERGYGSMDKLVCEDCIGDYAQNNLLLIMVTKGHVIIAIAKGFASSLNHLSVK